MTHSSSEKKSIRGGEGPFRTEKNVPWWFCVIHQNKSPRPRTDANSLDSEKPAFPGWRHIHSCLNRPRQPHTQQIFRATKSGKLIGTEEHHQQSRFLSYLRAIPPKLFNTQLGAAFRERFEGLALALHPNLPEQVGRRVLGMLAISIFATSILPHFYEITG